MSKIASNILIDRGCKSLKEICQSPRIEAESVLAKVLRINRIDLYKEIFDVHKNQENLFFSLIKLRSEGMPMAYILGKKDFWTISLEVNENVLIPRPESEHLVERALRNLPNINNNYNILELGTGSGAIAISIAKERPCSSIIATDISLEALSLAQSNALRNKAININFMASDWFDALTNIRFESIVVNPPYIDQNNESLYDLSTLKYEPELALFAEDEGRESIYSIIKEAPLFLEPGGSLIIEHGFDQNLYCKSMMKEYGFINIKTTNDYNDHARITEGFLQD